MVINSIKYIGLFTHHQLLKTIQKALEETTDEYNKNMKAEIEK